jgi:nicotinamidase-related amidase
VTEICVDRAVRYLAGDLGYNVLVFEDAIKELDRKKADCCFREWLDCGAKII